MRSLRTTAIAIIAAALLGTGAATAVASSGDSGGPQASSSSSSADTVQQKQQRKQQNRKKAPAPKRDGAKRLCKRAPRIEKRLERRLHRLNGGVTRAGSVNRLEKRVELAKQADHDAVATYLGDRLKNRRTLPHKLDERKKDLSKVRSWCKARNDHGARS